MTLFERFQDSLKNRDALGVAVSGGSDSLALLHLSAQLAEAHGIKLRAATVDHGLRDEAKAECALVARVCERLGVQHDVLNWTWDKRGNLQAAARAGRYKVLARWASKAGLGQVALGHTQNDVAETFLMRMARGSGVTGLSQMKAEVIKHEVTWTRPLLTVTRDQLRAFLREQECEWCEDNSNSDTRFSRVKARGMMSELEALGLTQVEIAKTAKRLSSADEALDYLARNVAKDAVTVQGGDLVFDLVTLDHAPEETQQRLFSQALAWIGNTDYPPRRKATLEALSGLKEGQQVTLNGCVGIAAQGHFRLTRELNAVSSLNLVSTALWDGRMRLVGPHAPDVRLAALGEAGLPLCPDWRKLGVPRASLLASPAIWRKEELVAAPLAGFENGWRMNLQSAPPFLL